MTDEPTHTITIDLGWPHSGQDIGRMIVEALRELERPMTRILWNRRPANPSDTGDIDEIVVKHPKAVHIEQMGDRQWWIQIDMDDGGYWAGNFTANSRGHMTFGEQENAGIEWDVDNSHEVG